MKNTRKLLAVLLAAALLLACVAPALAEYGFERLYVNGVDATKVHLRQQATTASASLGLIYSGTEVKVLSRDFPGWIQIQIGSETGFMSAKYLSQVQPESKAPVAYVYNPNSSWSYLRSGADREAQDVGRLYNDEIVYVLGELESGWSYVQRGAQSGFVVSDFLRSNTQQGTQQGTQQPSGTDYNRIPVPNPSMQVMGHTSAGDAIYCFIAPDNAQSLYFVAPEGEHAVYREDVNFDGQPDLAVNTISGTSNHFFVLFVRSGSMYVPVQVPQLGYDLCNYQLYPQQKLLLSSANNGAAGAYHDKAIFRWNGAELVLVRRATAEMPVDDYDQNGLIISAANPQLLKIRVVDYTSGTFEGTVLYENVILLAGAESNMQVEEAAFWQDLR